MPNNDDDDDESTVDNVMQGGAFVAQSRVGPGNSRIGLIYFTAVMA